MKEATKPNKKIKTGTVVSNKMQNTVVVSVETTMQHPKYSKVIRRKKNFHAHTNEKIDLGEEVTIIETRPLSKMKRWRVTERHQG